MKARVLQTKIWQDDFFWSLTVAEKLLFIYYIANESITILNLYEVPDRKVVYDTGVDLETVQIAKRKFEGSGKLHFYKDWVYVTNAYRYQTYSGRRNVKSAISFYESLPNEVSDWFNNLPDTAYILSRYLPYSKSKSKSKPYPYNKPSISDEININEISDALDGKELN